MSRKCYICPELLADRSALAAHLAERHDPADYKKCEECSLEFLYLNSYNRHLGRHSESDRPIKCSLCALRFVSQTGLKVHVKAVHDQMPKSLPPVEERPICETCGKSFATKDAIRKHLSAVHSADRKFPCKICHKSLVSNNGLERHMMTHTGEKPFSCSQCDSSFTRALYLREHMVNVHGAKNPFVCPECNKEFRIYLTMYLHRKAVHLKNGKQPVPKPKPKPKVPREEYGIIACKLCDHKASRHVMRSHIETAHPNETYPYLKCADCPRTFLTSTAWAVHIPVHTDKYACKECGIRFRSSNVLRNHKEVTHPDGTRWECPLCPGKQFKSFRTLHNHRSRIHKNEKAYECNLCHQQFTRKASLDRHRRRHHTGENRELLDAVQRSEYDFKA